MRSLGPVQDDELHGYLDPVCAWCEVSVRYRYTSYNLEAPARTWLHRYPAQSPGTWWYRQRCHTAFRFWNRDKAVPREGSEPGARLWQEDRTLIYEEGLNPPVTTNTGFGYIPGAWETGTSSTGPRRSDDLGPLSVKPTFNPALMGDSSVTGYFFK